MMDAFVFITLMWAFILLILSVVFGVPYLLTYGYPFSLKNALIKAEQLSKEHNINAVAVRTWYGYTVHIKKR